MLLPKPGPLPQTSQLAATGHSKDFRCTYMGTPAHRESVRIRVALPGKGPIRIGQPEQHTTAASVQRNYHVRHRRPTRSTLPGR
jgi:hypothetical protein